MPKNVMKLLKPSPHRARNDFDLSHRHILSANFGELLPVTCIETVPGDHIEMHASDLLRAIPMVTSPFLRAKQHMDVWFVPYRDLWHNFDAFITRKAQPVSSALRDAAYCPYFNLYDIWDDADSNVSNILNQSNKDGAKRLLQLLGYGDGIVGASAANNVNCNPFRLAAYHYIWYNEYRQQYYDDGMWQVNATSYNAASVFNFDNLACDTLANAEIPYMQRKPMTQMRYRTWKKDLFTGLLPSTQFGAVSTFGSNTLNVKLQSPTTFSSDYVTLEGRKAPGNLISVKQSGQETRTNLYTESAVDVLALRRSEAIQIWRENALRSGNRTKDNMTGHYGVESDYRDHRPTYLGSVSSPLNIGDIMTTANSDYSGNTNPNTNVGDVAGKGLSSLDDEVFKFDAKDFGVIMVMFSILPEAEYNAEGVDRLNQLLEPEDFFTPEYENLGLEAVSSQTFRNTVIDDSRVLGYAPRYFGYKTKLDKCFDEFCTNGMNASWCSPKYDVTTMLGNPSYTLPLSVLYINPKIFDVNFAVAYGTSHQFLCDFYFDVDAVRPMSVVGLPFS